MRPVVGADPTFAALPPERPGRPREGRYAVGRPAACCWSLTVIAALLSGVAWAAPVSLTTTPGTWSTGAHWSGGAIPGAADAVSIGTASLTPAQCTLTNSASVSSVTLAGSSSSVGQLTVASGGDLTITSALQICGGSAS